MNLKDNFHEQCSHWPPTFALGFGVTCGGCVIIYKEARINVFTSLVKSKVGSLGITGKNTNTINIIINIKDQASFI